MSRAADRRFYEVITGKPAPRPLYARVLGTAIAGLLLAAVVGLLTWAVIGIGVGIVGTVSS